MILKRDKQTHDLSDSDILHIMDENIGNHKTFTCQVSWTGLVGTGAKVILRGSNSRIPSSFDNLAIEVELSGSSGSANLSDDRFPNDFGGAFIEKNNATEGIIILKFLAK